MNTIEDSKVHARHYRDNLPTHAIAVDEPWWWTVLALGAEVINVHFQTDYRGSLALVSREQTKWNRRQDVEAIEAILRAAKRPTFDAWRCPFVPRKIVGLVEVVDCVEDPVVGDPWFVGPYALKVGRPCLLPIGGDAETVQGLIQLSPEQKDSIVYRLTMMAAGHLQPGEQP